MKTKSSISKIFREEAIKHYSSDPDSGGLLKPSPMWSWFVLIVTGVLIILAAVFVTVAEVEVLDRAEGMVQIGDTQEVMQAANNQWFVAAFLADRNGPFVHAGDSVRLELRDYPIREFGTLDGRILRIIPAQIQPNADPGVERTPSSSWRMVIAVVPPASGPLTKVQLRAGMLVNVRLTLRKQRLITFMFAPPRQ